MAGSSIAQFCPICKEPVLPGDGRVAGFDQSAPGRPPANIVAHRGCFGGCVIVRPGQTFAQAVAAFKAQAA